MITLKQINIYVDVFKANYKLTYPLNVMDILQNMNGLLVVNINIRHPAILLNDNKIEIQMPSYVFNAKARLKDEILLLFAHFMMHMKDAKIYNNNPFYRKNLWQQEQEAARLFVLVLLMPEYEFRDAIYKHEFNGETDMVKVASMFGVGVDIAMQRALMLGLVK